jgi:hypothetical protein
LAWGLAGWPGVTGFFGSFGVGVAIGVNQVVCSGSSSPGRKRA